MKVLHIISGGDSGGAKTHLLALVKGLQQHVKIKVVCLIPGDFYQAAVECGYDVVLINQKSRFDINVAKQIAKIIKDEHFDLLHCHGARANFVGWFVMRKVRIPSVTTVHSDFNKDFVRNFYKRIVFTALNKIALKKFDYYIAVSEELRELLVNHNIKNESIFIVNNGIDFNLQNHNYTKADFCKRYNITCSLTDKWVGIAARLNIVKGHITFIDAAAQVLKSNPDVTFLIAGDGEEKDNILHHIRTLGLESKVILTGFCKNVYEFLSVIDINVMASSTEGLPYVLLESAASKKVMVSTNVGAIPLLIRNGESGLLYNPGDSAALANHLNKLLDGEGGDSLREEMGQKLYDIGKEKFSIETMTENHLSIYNKILNLGK